MFFYTSLSHAQMTISQTTAMSFGTILANPSGDIIHVRPNGRVTAQNGSILYGSSSSTLFRIRNGTPNAVISISFSNGNVLNGVGTPMVLDGLYHNKGTTPSLNGRGRLTFKVGGYLTINSNQLGGAYSGTYTVFVDYN